MTPIYYSLATGCIRRHSRPSFKGEVIPLNVRQGEGVIQIEEDEYQRLAAQSLKEERAFQYVLQDLIIERTGIALGSDRVVLVDKSIQDPLILDKDGNVKGVIHADLTCGDTVEGLDLIPDPVADVGWKYTDQDGFVKLATAEATIDGV